MTFGKFMKAVGSAFMYFGIYLAWQYFVVSSAMTGAQVAFSLAGMKDIIAAALEGVEYSYDQIMEATLGATMNASAWLLEQTVLLTIVAGVLAIATYVVMFVFRKKNPLREVGIAKMPIPVYFGMVLFGVALNLAVSFLLPLIPFPEVLWDNYAAQSEMLLGARVWTVILTVIIAPILEEVVFRGLMHTRFKRCMPVIVSMIISALIFGFMHMALIAVIYASLLGLLLAWVFEKYNSLLASILVHFGFNLCAILLEGFEDIPLPVCIAAVVISLIGIVIVQITGKGRIFKSRSKEPALCDGVADA